MVSCSGTICSAQNLIDNYLSGTISYSVIGTSADGVNSPRDLDFKPNSNELWVVNKGTSSGGSVSIFYKAGEAGQTSQYRKDSHSDHFMIYPSAIAFGDDGRWAGISEIKNTASASSTFMGPALWSSDTSIFARVSQNAWVSGYPLGSHLDMLHQSPFGMGIAHDSAGIYWVFDGYTGDIAKYQFVADHGPGYEDHSQGKIWRYTEVTVTRVPNVPSHLVKDKTSGWLYFIDGGAKKLKRLNTMTGSVFGTLSVPSTATEPLLGYWDMRGAAVEVLDSFMTSQPCGIDVYNNRLVVSDYANGNIYVYDISLPVPVRLGTISTTLTGIMGVKIGPDGKIWCVDNTANKVYKISPSASVNNDASIAEITAPVVNDYKTGFYNIKFNDCGTTITPIVKLENPGSNTLTSVTIKYQLDNGTVNTYSWTGSLATNANASVTLPAVPTPPGAHKLTVYTTNPNGSTDSNPANDKKDGSFRTLTPAVPYPFSESFSSSVFPPSGWNYINYNPNNEMAQIAGIGGFGVNTGCVKMDNFSGAENITGQVDYLMTPNINMVSATSGTVLTFSVAHAQYNAGTNDKLAVKVSTDCGNTWASVYDKSGSTLSTAAATTSDFSPAATEWRKETVSLNAYTGQPNVMIMFVTTSNFGNNIYIDDINMMNTTGVEALQNNKLSVYPNPSSGIFTVDNATGTKAEITICDVVGRIVKRTDVPAGAAKIDIDLSDQNNGSYIMNVISGNQQLHEKITVLK